MGSASREAVGR